MSNFKIGDRVLCVFTGLLGNNKGNPPPLRKGAEYVVMGIDQCPCGEVALDVGISTVALTQICPDCNRSQNTNGIRWCDSRRFVKKAEDKAEMVKLEKKVKAEPVFSQN